MVKLKKTSSLSQGFFVHKRFPISYLETKGWGQAGQRAQNLRGGPLLNGLNPEPLPLGMELPVICTTLLMGEELLE